MQQQFGDQASRQIGALQSGIALPGQQRSQGLQLPGQPMPTHVPQQYQTPQPQQPQQQQRNGLGGAQTDGADDAMEEWNAIVMRRNALGQHEQLGTVAIDRMIRRQIEDMGQRMEGGGLMLPLSERVSTISRRKRGTKKSATSRSRSGLRARSAQFQSSDPRELLPAVSELSIDANEPKIPQLDGGDDSDDGIKGEDFDEDAINSELDDSDDNIAEEDDEDESIGQIMLCTYDKVQRVKNKWKCTLKDGVLTTGNRE
ncbi:TFIIA-domain-containing protein [Xylona heveae TC161]|uniref:TFIIA-domain-containing protein n=1 Tax=Xylona heveae (strain CBS 132557 / TC161) TaxID=1328760 RepID=A0A165GAS6_XYLHT|nr:TFIIA-domain-containing protein [Xylona heveae TC161]KZF21959.1 TFIIA-domain-containing protein [Xylona heveae TC161]